MAGMPVATLRIWERRHRVVDPTAMPSGHRLYSAAQVEKLILLRQLSDAGHAIGTTAGLETAELRALHSATPVWPARDRAAAGATATPSPALRPWRVAVVGSALARRLQRPGVRRRLAFPLHIVSVFDTLDDVGAATRGSAGAQRPTPQAGVEAGLDLLLVQLPGLHPDTLPVLQKVCQALRARQMCTLYRFASAAVCDAFTAHHVALLREPQADAALALWLNGQLEKYMSPAEDLDPKAAGPAQPQGEIGALAAGEDPPPRRYGDAALEALSRQPSGVVCECPRHLGELLQLLVQFEGYSAECRHATPEDAALHALLGQAAGRSRAIFEQALDLLVAHEGLTLPT